MNQSRQVFKLWGDGEIPYHKENDLQEYEEKAWLAKKMVPINGYSCSSTG